MDAIFHEQQEGQLCAQHCLNNLLQAPYFTAVDLANLANELDEDERLRMAEGGVDSPQYLRFLKQPSANMDDSGYFSGQVISRALELWLLTMTPLSSPRMMNVLKNPVEQRAFICNHDNHWLTVRKLGKQWFDLNSLHRSPELISDTYLSLFLTQLQMEGYTIFVVEGDLPPCEADHLLSLVPVEPQRQSPTSKQPPISRHGGSGGHHSKSSAAPSISRHSGSGGHHSKSSASPSRTREGVLGSGRGHRDDEEDSYALDLAKALSVSMAGEIKGQPRLNEDEQFDISIASALSESLQDALKAKTRASSQKRCQDAGESGVGNKSQPAMDDDELYDISMASALSESLQDQQQQQQQQRQWSGEPQLEVKDEEHHQLHQLQRQSSGGSTGNQLESQSGTGSTNELTKDELRKKRLLRFEQLSDCVSSEEN